MVFPLMAVANSAWPNESNTGVPAGTSLSASGNVTTSSNGQIIEELEISGTVTINHTGVILRKCRITGSGSIFAVVHVQAGTATIEDCDILTTSITGGPKGIWFDGGAAGEVYRNNIRLCEDGVYVSGSTGGHIIEDNYIHDLNSAGGDPHYDGIQVDDNDVTINHNHLSLRANDSSAITHGAVTGGTITNNILNGGAYTLRIEVASSTGFTITGNRFGSYTFGYASLEGTVTPTISGNVDHFTDADIDAILQALVP